VSLTLISPNRNRLDFTKPSSQWFIKSIQWQDYKDFDVLIIDGGSNNYEDIKKYIEEYNGAIPMRIMQFKIGKDFHKTLLNNVAIRSCQSDYIATTDVDILFGPQFMDSVSKFLAPNVMVESRVMYWKDPMAKLVYEGIKNPYNIKECQIGRIKKCTTPGAIQCMSKQNWEKLRGYDENYVGWGSEDYDLVVRAKMAKINIRWLGESNGVMAFHQPHPRDTKSDLAYQEKNKKILNSVRTYQVNPNGWGNQP
jgi:predicted glycosyltransferase involved in capsule biosynthesis